jgi:hypothetical protein
MVSKLFNPMEEIRLTVIDGGGVWFMVPIGTDVGAEALGTIDVKESIFFSILTIHEVRRVEFVAADFIFVPRVTNGLEKRTHFGLVAPR